MDNYQVYYLDQIKQTRPSLTYHGISRENKNQVKIISKNVKGTIINIAFGSYYTGRESCPHSVCTEDDQALIESFKKTEADFKVLMIHTMSDQSKLLEVAHRFIDEANGDVVLEVVPIGGNQFALNSLGNFIHQNIARLLINP